ncbi:hypothetical protein NEUTE1DRAFT_47895 [Neurospora tetrasperma FGSC 2508]|uniref:DUF6594 domain-containing protein n=1 Tax=Neurospora tetrasperma (strain FGSC 2508 / ATCC MYA-4615 / P0657) TaxID=510951 RepID=F8MS68_NEUT8|nr:uncharacterized protein NEUTE1DRAFT_47895 [Neurospora tetrasperma FGSC 2508]EGO55862.1 hypothetical protein NEUTE1DRAFT_47895 [Neurospora tetrasperma FGSC 2508]EGZ68881.1 hypothetical protein NEUTE2DRAFT_168557 [Neurospora tetrasperma FGSC 2509]
MAVRVRKKGLSSNSEGVVEGLDQFGAVLKKYVRAVQDHEYMAKFALERNDPFIATSGKHNDRIFFEAALFNEGLDLEDFLPADLSRASKEGKNTQPSSAPLDGEPEGERRHREWIERVLKASIPTGPWETGDGTSSRKSASALVNTRTASAKIAFWERVGAAVIGGAFLIGPMWILALERNLFVHLGVATACVTAFGLSCSFYLKTVDGVFAATLAYAAVIMVFVGVVLEEAGGIGA